jgi:hypothetical protein
MAKDFSKQPKKQQFLNSIPQDSISNSDILTRSKFNFSYFDSTHPGQDFVDWNTSSGNSKLVKLMGNLKNFTREPLSYWENKKIGKGKRGGRGIRQSCLEIYKRFPKKSNFSHPAHVPEDVWWARFRIDNNSRLIGFVIPDKIECTKNNEYDRNTFYVVFLDENHEFYQT